MYTTKNLEWMRAFFRFCEQARWIVNDLMDEMEHLDEKVRVADARLRKATIEDPQIKKLMKEPGIGEVTAWTLRAKAQTAVTAK